MRITRLFTTPLQFFFERPIEGVIYSLRSVECILVHLETDAGLVGEGLLLTLNGAHTRLINDMVLALEPLVLGQDPEMSGALLERAWGNAGFIGRTGFSAFGIAAIDCALWDLRAKAVERNVARLIGKRTDAVPVYWSGDLWLDVTIDQLQRRATDAVARGYRAIKMRLGKPTIREDVARVRAVREAVGPAIELMADANQQFTIEHAIRFGRLIEDCHLAWLEEPIPYENHVGEAAICAALDTPIASGESEFAVAGMHDMLMAKAVDILTPDLERVGGPTAFLKAADLAAAYNVRVSSHLFSEMSLPLVSACANAIYLEHMPWTDWVYRERIELDSAGRAIVPERPGWGFSFDPKSMKRFAMNT